MANLFGPLKTIKLKSGNTMPPIGLGTWQLHGKDAEQAVLMGLDLGYRQVDTSNDYGNLSEVKDALQKTAVPRSELFITTKVEETDETYTSAKQYVRQLGLDYADLIIIHRPPYSGAGEQLWEGLRQARDEGLATDIGVSSYSIEQMQALYDASGEWPAVNQIEWTPFGHSLEMLKFCRKQGIVIQAYSPLAHSGKMHNVLLNELADTYGKTSSQIVLRWDTQHGVVPLPKSSSREHLAENFNVFDFELSPQDMKRIDGLNEHYSALGHGSLSYA
jgi:2,5-diketo-D-gluconate reductase A